MASLIDINNLKKSTGITELRFVNCEFCWEIKSFTQFPPDAIVKSPIFEGGSLKWQFQMIPHTIFVNAQGSSVPCVMFILNPIGSAPENCLAKADLQIENVNDTEEIRRAYNFKSTCQGFVNWENIGQTKIYFRKLHCDTMRLVCRVTLYNPEFNKSFIISEDPVEATFGDKFLKDWTRLFQSMDNSDISINVRGNILSAHKTILSIRSTVFERMFLVEMKESVENVIQIDDFEPEDVNAMLEFIYTGQTEAVKNNPEILLQLAEKYDLPDLKFACGVQLSQGVDIENAIERLYLADRINIPNLKSYVEKFIIRNKKEVFKTEAFKEAAPRHFLDLFATIIAQD